MEKLNIDNKKILNITTLLILIAVPFLKFFSMNLEMFGILKDYDSINPAIILYVSVPILIYIYIKDIIKNNRKLDIFDYIFYVLVFAGVISTIFSINKNISIFGKELRHEGFLSVLCYYLIFINYKVNGTKEDIKKHIKLIIAIGIINSIYALFQIYTDFSFILRFDNNIHMASGLCGNPNFFGSLMVTVISIWICKMLISKKVEDIDYSLLILFFISLINAQSTGPFLAFIITYIFLILFLSIKKKLILSRVLVITIVLIITFAFLIFMNILSVSARKEISLSSVSTDDFECEMCIGGLRKTISSGGNGRLEIWENSFGIVKDNPLIGVGFDNFVYAYPNPKIDNSLRFTITESSIKKEVESYLIADNAHNVYLHTLVSTGILGTIPYLLLCLLTFIKGLKSKDKLLLILLGGFVAYSIQAFANISVVQVAPIYYLIIGLILSIKE